MIAFDKTFLGSEQFPLVWQITRGHDAEIDAVLSWLRDYNPMLAADRDRYGAVLLRGFDAIDSPKRFDAVLRVIAKELMACLDDGGNREVVYGGVVTVTGLPRPYSLPLHQENAYKASRPDALALFCEIPPDEGGETPVADARVVTSRIDPAVRARFDQKGIVVRLALSSPAQGEANPASRPWHYLFGTSDRAEVVRIAEEKQWKVEWRPDGSMHLWLQMLPAFKTHARTGERTWATQFHFYTPECSLRWALRDGRMDEAEQICRQMVESPETLDRAFHNDGARVLGEDAEHVWDVLVESEIPLRWQRGDLLLLDNVLAMHGRRPYGGQRRILVGFIKD